MLQKICMYGYGYNPFVLVHYGIHYGNKGIWCISETFFPEKWIKAHKECTYVACMAVIMKFKYILGKQATFFIWAMSCITFGLYPFPALCTI